MIKLVGTRGETLKNVEFGTCECCFSVGDLHVEYLVFEDTETGKQTEIETGEWDWGCYDYIYEVDNIVDFAGFIAEKEIETLEELEDRFFVIYSEYCEKNQSQ